MPGTVFASVAAFVGTNLDDILLIMLFFAQAKSRREAWAITAGAYLGTGILTLLSLLAAFGLQLMPGQWSAWLGLIPIYLGVRAWLKREDDDAPETASGGLMLRVMLISLANGADNLGVYIPLFAGYTPMQQIAAVLVFAAMVALWCLLGRKLSDLPILRGMLLKHRQMIIPVVFVLLGIYILIA